MGMRSSDATFLRREVIPLLSRTAAISPEAAAVVEALSDRIERAAWPDHDRPAEPVVSWYDTSPELMQSNLIVDDWPIPYIRASRGRDWPEGAVSLTLDHRYGMDTTEEELARWAPFLANAMAVSAGRTSHGANSFIRNPHGRSGGGDPPALVGEAVSERPARSYQVTGHCSAGHKTNELPCPTCVVQADLAEREAAYLRENPRAEPWPRDGRGDIIAPPRARPEALP